MGADTAFAALAEPHRRAILVLVRDEPRSVTDIAAHFEISQQAVSLHLRVLRDAELVTVQPAGQRRLYALRPEGLDEVDRYLAEFWSAGLTRLKSAVESRQRRG